MKMKKLNLDEKVGNEKFSLFGGAHIARLLEYFIETSSENLEDLKKEIRAIGIPKNKEQRDHIRSLQAEIRALEPEIAAASTARLAVLHDARPWSVTIGDLTISVES